MSAEQPTWRERNGPVHQLPRALAWAVSVLAVAGMIDDGRRLIVTLLQPESAELSLLRLAVLAGFGGTALSLAFRPQWAPLPFLALVGVLAWRPEQMNLTLVALLLLTLAAALLDWLRLLSMVLPYLAVQLAVGGFDGAWLGNGGEAVATVVAVALGRAVWIVLTRKERSERETQGLIRAAISREQAAAAQAEMLRQRYETQRRELSHELHDVVAHELTRITMQATVAAQEAPDTATRNAFTDVADTGRRALGEMRRLMGMIGEEAPAAGDTVPRSSLGGSIDSALARAQEYLEQVGMQVEVERTIDVALPQSLHNAVGVLLREGSTNAAKHASPGSLCRLVVRTEDGQVRAEIRNQIGAEPSEPMPDSGFGLPLLRARVENLGGSFEAAPSQGWWVLAATWPLDRPARLPQ